LEEGSRRKVRKGGEKMENRDRVETKVENLCKIRCKIRFEGE